MQPEERFPSAYVPVCPACHEAMVTLEWQGIEVDYCIRCGGTWLDRGEFERILGHGAEPGSASEASLIEGGKTGKKTKRLCPRCDRRLVQVTVTMGKERVTLDRCAQGHGLWFDKGELQTCLRASASSGDTLSRISSFLQDLFGIAQ